MTSRMTAVVIASAVCIAASCLFVASRARPLASPKKVSVLVAKRSLNMGTPIKSPDDLFDEILYPAGEEPPQAIGRFHELKGRILKRSLRQGDLVRPDDLLGTGDPASEFEADLPKDFRCLSLRVNLKEFDGGYKDVEGHRVDLLLNVDGERTTLLENIVTLSVDCRRSADYLCFALSPDDVMKVVAAREQGMFTVRLRGEAVTPSPLR